MATTWEVGGEHIIDATSGGTRVIAIGTAIVVFAAAAMAAFYFANDNLPGGPDDDDWFNPPRAPGQ